MAIRYKKYADDPDLGSTNTIQRITEDGVKTCIPMVKTNRDYKEYLKWVADGGVTEAAD